VKAMEETALDRVRDAASDYFDKRDQLEAAKDDLLDAILEADKDHSQHEIADVCDLTNGDPESTWRFHRTRIQQFLREARRR
jgi:hypothetical protein